jgi:hypothetical protein
MNKNQRKIILVGIALIIFSVIIPPWKEIYFTEGKKTESETIVYKFLLNPPKEEYKNNNGQVLAVIRGRIDSTRLLLEWVFVGIITGAFLLYLKKPA